MSIFAEGLAMRGTCRRGKGVALLLGRSLRSRNLSCIQNTSVSRIGGVPAFWADKNSRAAKKFGNHKVRKIARFLRKKIMVYFDTVVLDIIIKIDQCCCAKNIFTCLRILKHKQELEI